MSGMPITGKRYSKSEAELLSVTARIKEITVRLRQVPKTASRTANGASTSRLPWDSVPDTSSGHSR